MTTMPYKGYEAIVEFDDEAEKPFSGHFVVRIEPGLHREAATAARRAGLSLNKWVAKALERAAG